MNKLDTCLQNLKKPALMAHCIIGYPTVEESIQVARALRDGGAEIIELQIPFSDPLADGPTILRASQEALAQGTRVSDVFRVLEVLSSESDTPLLVMCYANTVLHFGMSEFVERAVAAGATGFIIPDLPVDTPEGAELVRAIRVLNAHLILVVSPGMTRERLEALKPFSGGFIYCTSRQGITGADSAFASELESYLNTVRSVFGLPIGLGFGVATAEDYAAAARHADIVIAGSVFVKAISEKGIASLTDQARQLRG